MEFLGNYFEDSWNGRFSSYYKNGKLTKRSVYEYGTDKFALFLKKNGEVDKDLSFKGLL